AARCSLSLRDEIPEEAIVFVVDAGGEVECARYRIQRARGEAEPPQTENRKWLGQVVQQPPFEVTGRAIVGIDAPVAEVADQDVAAEGAEGRRRQGHSPGRVEPAFPDEPLEQVPIGTEDVNESVARTRQVVVLIRLLLGEGDVQIATDVM